MSFNYNADKLKEIMVSFYTLTGIKFVIYDSDYNEILAYPDGHCGFCSYMRSHHATECLCRKSDERSFEECRNKDGLIIYHCHAGLIEAAAPIKESGITIGYVMFGQISDSEDNTDILTLSLSLVAKLNVPAPPVSLIEDIKYKSRPTITAAAKIMETCISYIILKEMITPRGNDFTESVNNYIDSHLSSAFPEGLCAALKMSRSSMYDAFEAEFHCGVSAYILSRRISAAKRLLKSTDMPVSEISKAVGYNDYNYFSRIFRRLSGISPSGYRKR